MKYRKKPAVIEARRFEEDASNARQLRDWIGADAAVRNALATPTDPTSVTAYLDVRTLEGTMTAIPGDWIIRGVRGEFYPCKPDIFAATYEPADPDTEETR